MGSLIGWMVDEVIELVNDTQLGRSTLGEVGGRVPFVVSKP